MSFNDSKKLADPNFKISNSKLGSNSSNASNTSTSFNREINHNSFYKKKKYIESFGIVLFTVVENTILYLLVQKRDSYEYMDLLMGTWKTNDDVVHLVNGMSKKEKKRLINNDFDTLWNDLFATQNSYICREYERARDKYHSIINLTEIIENCNTSITLQWGFPKGRKEAGETTLECAKREFVEETGYSINIVNIVNTKTFSEFYTGNNKKSYCTHYFIGSSETQHDIVYLDNHTDLRKKMISSEIGDMKWCELNIACNLLSNTRSALLKKIDLYIRKNCI